MIDILEWTILGFTLLLNIHVMLELNKRDKWK